MAMVLAGAAFSWSYRIINDFQGSNSSSTNRLLPRSRRDGQAVFLGANPPWVHTVTASAARPDREKATVSRRIVVVDAAKGVDGGAGTFMVPAQIARAPPALAARGGLATFGFLAPAPGDAAGASTAMATVTTATVTAPRLVFMLDKMHFLSKDLRLVDARGARRQYAGNSRAAAA
jgi:hypothetical protein